MGRSNYHDMEIVKGTGEEPPLRPYEAYYSEVLDAVRVKMPDGDIFQWPMIKKPPNLRRLAAIHDAMQMVTPSGDRSELYRAVYQTIRDETHRQLGDAFYYAPYKFVHQRVVDYITAKARVEYPILMRFTDDWATVKLIQRSMWLARSAEYERQDKERKPNPVKKRKRESEAK